jgi:hypothetical protein
VEVVREGVAENREVEKERLESERKERKSQESKDLTMANIRTLRVALV